MAEAHLLLPDSVSTELTLCKAVFTLAHLTELNAHRMRIGRVHTVLRPMRID